MPNFHQQEEGNQTKNRRKQVHFYLFFFLLNSNKYMRCSGLFFPFFSEAGGLKSFIFIYLSVCLFVFFSSNPNMVESGDSSRERSSSLFFNLMANSTHRVSWRREGRGEQKTGVRKEAREVRVTGVVGVRRAWKCPLICMYSSLLLYIAPLPSNRKMGQRGEESERSRQREWARFGLAYPELLQPKVCVTFL